MEESSAPRHQPASQVAHDLMNKLSVLIGQCDLLMEKTPQESPTMKHALTIQMVARSMVEGLNELQSDLSRFQVLKQEKARGA
jgi:hypothetical protein